MPDGARSALEEKLQALAGVAAVRHVKPSEGLARLEDSDPGLARILSKGPRLPEVFELTVEEDRLGRLQALKAEAESAEPGLEVRFKPLEAEAILQARAYGVFASRAGLTALLALAAAAGWASRKAPRPPGWMGEAARPVGLGTLGSAWGLALAWGMGPGSGGPEGLPEALGAAIVVTAGTIHGWCLYRMRS